MFEKNMLYYQMRKRPKAIATIIIWKQEMRTRLMAEPNGKKVIDETMDDPQVLPKSYLWFLDMVVLQRLNGSGVEGANHLQ